MKLGKVVLENFQPYFERHSIDLSVTREAPIVLVHGENERGKTSLANAIRWCLYQVARGRGGTTIPSYRLINSHARESGQYAMSVSLEFEHQGDQYLLERHVEADRAPTNDRELQFYCQMRKNSRIEPPGNIDRVIRDILHPNIARFFFFDGEMLNEYEDLLRDPEQNTRVVRQSIEQILGLPSLQRTAALLEDLRRAAERRQAQEMKMAKVGERMVVEAQQKDEALTAAEADLANQQAHKSRLLAERDELRQQLEQFAEILADVKQIDRCEEEIAAIENEMGEGRASIQRVLQQVWWLSMEPRLEAEAARVEQETVVAAGTADEIAQLSMQIAQCERSLADGKCSLCGYAPQDAELTAFHRCIRERRSARACERCDGIPLI